MMVNLGEKSNLDVIHERIPLHGKTVADIGCGSLGFTREISSHCQQVFAIDPSPEVAEQFGGRMTWVISSFIMPKPNRFP